MDELTLIFVSLSVPDKDKEMTVKRVCEVLKNIDYIDNTRRMVIDSLISFQIENFVKSKDEKEKLNKVVNMQMSVEELFVQVEREAEYDKGFENGHENGRDEGFVEGFEEGKDSVILNMLDDSFDLDVIQRAVGCSMAHILEIRDKHLAGK